MNRGLSLGECTQLWNGKKKVEKNQSQEGGSSRKGKGPGRKDLKEGHQICDKVVTDGLETFDAVRGAEDRKKWKEARLHRVAQK